MPTFTVSIFAEGFPTKLDCRKKGALILTSLLEDLALEFLQMKPALYLAYGGGSNLKELGAGDRCLLGTCLEPQPIGSVLGGYTRRMPPGIRPFGETGVGKW